MTTPPVLSQASSQAPSPASPPAPPPLEHLDRIILTLALPAVAENLLRSAVFFADTLMVGWLRDEAALAAAGLAGSLMYLFHTLSNALAVSATALVARAWGAGDQDLARRTGGQAMILSVLFALLVTAIGLPLADDFLRLMGAEPEVVAVGQTYLVIILAGSLFAFPMSVANGVMRGAGDTRMPMWTTLAMNIWNVGVSLVLVFGWMGFPALGLAGAGWGTTSAGAVGGILSILVLLRGFTGLQLRWSDLRVWDPVLIRRILRLALPSAGEAAVGQSGHLIFTRMVASLGTVALAAHQIALRVESLSYMPAWGLAVAATTIVGQSLGANRPDIAEQATRRTLTYSLVFNSLLSLLFVTAAGPIVALFGGTPQVLALAGVALAISAAEMPTLGAQMILAGAFRGAGDTRTPMWVTFIGVLIFRLSLVYFLAIYLEMGLAGVWWGTAADWAGRALMLWIFFRRGTWRDTVVD